MNILEEFQNYNLLYIEDDKDLSKEAYTLFEKVFHRVYVANNGVEGLSLFKSNDIDIIISDIKMPKLNGIDMVAKIREINTSIPIILTSAYDDKYLLKNALQLNITYFIEKPYNLNELKDALSEALKLLKSLDNYFDFKNGHRFNLDNLELFYKDLPIHLMPQERKILKILIKNYPNVVSYESLEYLLNEGDYTSKEALRVAIGSLRKKIGKEKIKNRSKEGYYLCDI